MEFLEAVSVFSGRDHGFLHDTADAGVGGRCGFLPAGFFDDRVYHCAEVDLWRSGVRLALSGVYHSHDQRRTVFLYGDFGSVPGKDLYGGEKEAHLPLKRKNVNFNEILTA